MRRSLLLTLTAAMLVFAGGTVFAEDSGVRLEARGGIGLPTFDIADAAEIGPGGGIGVWYSPVDAHWALGAEFDFGMHSGADMTVGGKTTAGPDVNVYHAMAKAGYTVLSNPDSRLSLVLNAGAGMVMFDVDAPGADMESYPAINAGGKLFYAVSPMIDFVLSLQGDISFTDKDVLGTDNAWVWPLAAGFSFRL